MKFFFLILLITLKTANGNAQNSTIHKQKSLNLSILGISYDYEYPVTSVSSIIVSGELGYGFLKVKEFETKQRIANGIAPVLNFETRHYYNLEKRNFLNKNTDANSADFISLSLGYIFPSLTGDLNIIEGPYIIPSWGLQRKVLERFHFEFKAGLYFNSFTEPLQEKPFILGIGLNIKFGYVFGSKKISTTNKPNYYNLETY